MTELADKIDALACPMQDHIDDWLEYESEDDWWEYQRHYKFLHDNLPTITRALRDAERMREAGNSVIAQAFDFTARNGRKMSIEGEDGEKCWIVPFDAFEELRQALGDNT